MCVDRDGPRRADLNGGRGGGGGCGAHHSMSQEGNSRGTSGGCGDHHNAVETVLTAPPSPERKRSAQQNWKAAAVREHRLSPGGGRALCPMRSAAK